MAKARLGIPSNRTLREIKAREPDRPRYLVDSPPQPIRRTTAQANATWWRQAVLPGVVGKKPELRSLLDQNHRRRNVALCGSAPGLQLRFRLWFGLADVGRSRQLRIRQL